MVSYSPNRPHCYNVMQFRLLDVYVYVAGTDQEYSILEVVEGVAICIVCGSGIHV